MDYNLTIALLEELNQFETANPKGELNIENFRIWLNEKAYREKHPIRKGKNDLKLDILENELCKQLIWMGRYLRSFVKKAVADYPEIVADEFTYLFRLMYKPNMTKSELIELNAHDKSFGFQTIKRLIKAGHIKEVDNPKDSRALMLTLTPKGEKAFEKLMENVTLASKLMFHNLTLEEKQDLLQLVKNFNDFHESMLKLHDTDSLQKLDEYLKSS